MTKQLRQSDLDDLSAFIDGELPDERTAEVRRLVDVDEAWQAAWRDMTAVDAAMDAYDSPAAPPDLAARIAANVAKAAPARSRLVFWFAAPLAAAAAIVLAVLAYHSIATQAGIGGTTIGQVTPMPTPPPVNTNKEVDQFASENFDFVKELDVLNNFETIKAIDKIEEESNG
ncbi:MAG: anti-sigma factor [Phycisphaerae bacterium]